jgi:hypothetical protein
MSPEPDGDQAAPVATVVGIGTLPAIGPTLAELVAEE